MAEDKIVYSTIEGNSKAFWGLVAFLVVLVMGGTVVSYMRFTEGHQIVGMTNHVPWTVLKIMAVYFIGLSAGSLVLSALSAVFGIKAFKPFARIAALVAAILLMGSLVCIILAWGRPERIFNPYLYFNFHSVYSLNGILYPSYIGICFVYLWAMFTGRDRLVPAIGITAIGIAVFVHSGTGAIFSFIGSNELYSSPLLPPAFVAAALSSGTALMILLLLATFKFTGRSIKKSTVQDLAGYMTMFIMVVIYIIFIENITRAYFPAHQEIQHFLMASGNKHSWFFWLGMVGLGNVFPLIVLLLPKIGKSIPGITFACAMVVIGVLAERYIIVIPAQLIPMELFPGYEVASAFQDGVWVDFSIGSLSVIQALGVAALISLMYLFSLKFLELLPETD